MKRILFVCCLLSATCAIPTQKVHAQTVSVSDFNTKINQLDSLIGAGNMTLAQAKWNEVHTMMISELAVTKQNIATSGTSYMATMTNQQSLYRDIWALKDDMTTNRVQLHTKLVAFAATF